MRTIFPTFPRIAIAAAGEKAELLMEKMIGWDPQSNLFLPSISPHYTQILMRVLPPVESILGQPSKIHLFMWWGWMQTFVSTGLDLELVPTVQNNSVAIAAAGHCTMYIALPRTG